MDENNKDIQLEEMMEQSKPELILPEEDLPDPANFVQPEEAAPVQPEEAAPVQPEDVQPAEEPEAPEPADTVSAEESPVPDLKDYVFEEETAQEAGEIPSPEPAAEEPQAPVMEEVIQDTGLLGGGVAQLREISGAIEDLSRAEQECRDTEKYLKGKTKELEIQKKRVEEKIAATVKKARADLEKSFDNEIDTAEKAIKEAETQRKNAKAAAVNERMKRENSSLVDDNKVLSAEIKSRFKDAGVPGICRNSLYYSLFAPKRLKDYLICIAAILIFAGVIPFAVTQLVNGTVFKVLVWVLIVVFFAALYFLVAFWTKKGSRNEAINDMRSKVNQIKDNNRTIKSRNRNIKADPDESQYNLYEYDQMLESAKADLDKARKDKEQALDHFEQVESVQIREEQERDKAPVFEQMEKEIALMQEDYAQKQENLREAARVMDEYNAELGEKGWKADKIDELISIIEEGRASTIREAMDVQKNK